MAEGLGTGRVCQVVRRLLLERGEEVERLAGHGRAVDDGERPGEISRPRGEVARRQEPAPRHPRHDDGGHAKYRPIGVVPDGTRHGKLRAVERRQRLPELGVGAGTAGEVPGGAPAHDQPAAGARRLERVDGVDGVDEATAQPPDANDSTTRHGRGAPGRHGLR
jgi:hypothetical protein